MYGYIYRTTNLINGKIYIGQKRSLEFNPNYKGSGKILREAINKYGWDNFRVELLIPCFSREELNAEEEFLIEWFGSRDRLVGYNICKGGECGPGGPRFQGHKHTDESKAKMSQARLGKKFSDTHKANLSKSISLARTGTSLSEDAKAKLSERNSGKGNPFYGKKHSEATKQHWSEVRRGVTRAYHFTCTECGESKVGTGSRQHICLECRARIEESRKAIVYKKQYRVSCKLCGTTFLGNSPKSNVCNNCKEGK